MPNQAENAILLAVTQISVSIVPMRVNKISSEQKESARLLRQLRREIGFSGSAFGILIGMYPNNLAQREIFRVPWKDSEIQRALKNLRMHLTGSLERLESVSKQILPQNTNPKI